MGSKLYDYNIKKTDFKEVNDFIFKKIYVN